MNKFEKLGTYLDSHKGDSFILSFTMIEEILGVKLCKSAYKYNAYWHPSRTHTLPNLIYKHHFIIDRVNLKSGILYLSYDGKITLDDQLKKNTKNIRTAYIDSSYKDVYLRETGFNYNQDDNTNLSILGLNVLKMYLSDLYYGRVENLEEFIKPFYSDENIVKYVARHYKLLSLSRNDQLLVKKDYDNLNLPNDYDYSNESYNYISKIIFALIGAIYLDNKNKDRTTITNCIKEIIKLIPNNRNK